MENPTLLNYAKNFSCQPSLRNMMFLSYLITEIAPTAQNSFFRQAGMGK